MNCPLDRHQEKPPLPRALLLGSRRGEIGISGNSWVFLTNLGALGTGGPWKLWATGGQPHQPRSGLCVVSNKSVWVTAGSHGTPSSTQRLRVSSISSRTHAGSGPRVWHICGPRVGKTRLSSQPWLWSGGEDRKRSSPPRGATVTKNRGQKMDGKCGRGPLAMDEAPWMEAGLPAGGGAGAGRCSWETRVGGSFPDSSPSLRGTAGRGCSPFPRGAGRLGSAKSPK